MRLCLRITAVLLASLPVCAQAQSDPAAPDTSAKADTPAQAENAAPNGSAPAKNVFDGNYLIVGGGATYGPSYEGSKHYVVFPVPAVQGRIGGVGITPRAGGVALDFISEPKGAKFGFTLGPTATYSGNRDDHIVDPVVFAAGRLKSDIAVGVTAGGSIYRVIDAYDSLSATVDVKWDVHGPGGGMEVNPSLSYFTPLSKAMFVSLSANAKHVNNAYANYYYSVSPAQSLGSGLPLYNARGGWASVGGNLLMGYSLGGDLRRGGFSVFAIGSYTRLMNDARFNPYTAIRGTPNQLVGGGGLAYTF